MVLAKHLNESDIAAIVNLIRGWDNAKLTWDLICKEAESIVGKIATRQSISSHQAISSAYKSKKASIKGTIPNKARPASLQIAAARIAKLEAELNEIKEQNRRYKQRFTVWQYNAYKKGLSESELNRPLPKIDRERSDNVKR